MRHTHTPHTDRMDIYTYTTIQNGWNIIFSNVSHIFELHIYTHSSISNVIYSSYFFLFVMAAVAIRVLIIAKRNA